MVTPRVADEDPIPRMDRSVSLVSGETPKSRHVRNSSTTITRLHSPMSMIRKEKEDGEVEIVDDTTTAAVEAQESPTSTTTTATSVS